MTIKYYDQVAQGSDEWLEHRRGRITGSEVKQLLTPTLKIASNDKSRAYIWELAAQRISGYIEPVWVSDDMLRGHRDEIEALALYGKKYADVGATGFVTREFPRVTIGCSPDGIVGDDGIVECKSRRQKYQIKSIVEAARGNGVPDEYILQIQSNLLVTGRKWCDFISYSGGLPMQVERVEADTEIQEAILEACVKAEAEVAAIIAEYTEAVKSRGFHMTKRIEDMEMQL